MMTSAFVPSALLKAVAAHVTIKPLYSAVGFHVTISIDMTNLVAQPDSRVPNKLLVYLHITELKTTSAFADGVLVGTLVKLFLDCVWWFKFAELRTGGGFHTNISQKILIDKHINKALLSSLNVWNVHPDTIVSNGPLNNQ